MSADLLAVVDRLVDLLRLVKEHCYHPDFHGSFSIKHVLPALAPGFGYDDLDITDGGMASVAFQEILPPDTVPARRGALQKSLLAYCKRDTEAMLELYKALSTGLR